MADRDIRWQQRFANYDRIINRLTRTVTEENLSELERAGLIKYYELAFELAWKLLKDYLEAEGFIVKSPRQVIKQAFQFGLIEDARRWLDALDDRNLTVHTYDDETAADIEAEIRFSYLPILQQLHVDFKRKIETEINLTDEQ